MTNPLKTSSDWYHYFEKNLEKHRIDWAQKPQISPAEKKTITKSLQAWQLGETSDGSNLLIAAKKYSESNNDPMYVEAVKLFIKEEQKHGNNLGRYLDLIGERRIQKDWGDSLFRKIRYLNHSMELWTLSVITVESTAQLFYQSLRDATGCPLLKEICTDILIDEAFHIDFQLERLHKIIETRGPLRKFITLKFYSLFFLATSTVVWLAHRKLFVAGGNHFSTYLEKIQVRHNNLKRKLQ